MLNDRGELSNSCFPAPGIECDRSCRFYSPDYRDVRGEECPLKKQKSQVWKITENFTKGLHAAICCLILLILAILGALVLNSIITKFTRMSTPTEIDQKPHGAVATDHADCSRIGTNLLQEGGNAIDAAVAATICMGVVGPHKTGLGGGGRMMIYSHRDRSNPLNIDFASDTVEGLFAAAKVRLPGFLRGLEFAQTLRGNLPWNKVVEPSKRLAESGFIVSEELAYEATKTAEHGMLYGQLRAGETLRLPMLAETLDAVGQYGCDILYNGTLSKKIVHDAIVREELLHQLASFEPRVTESQRIIFHNNIVYLPRHADMFRSMIEEVERLKISEDNSSSIEAQILMARSVVRKASENPELLMNLEEQRYSSVIAMDPKDNYVSIITLSSYLWNRGLSTPLGLEHMTAAGFLLDGVKTANTLESLTPIIFHDARRVCALRGVFGSDDATVAVQILYNLLLRSLNISASIEYPRFYMMPDGVAMELDERHAVDPHLLAQLESSVPVSRTNGKDILKSVNAVTKNEETLTSHSDSRGEGQASRY